MPEIIFIHSTKTEDALNMNIKMRPLQVRNICIRLRTIYFRFEYFPNWIVRNLLRWKSRADEEIGVRAWGLIVIV